MEASNFVGIFSSRKIHDISIRATVRYPYEKASVLESLFNKIAGINSRLATLMKKPASEMFNGGYIRDFYAFIGRSYTSFVF